MPVPSGSLRGKAVYGLANSGNVGSSIASMYACSVSPAYVSPCGGV